MRWRPAGTRQLLRRALPAWHHDAHRRCCLATISPALTVATMREIDVPTGWRSSGEIPDHIPLAMNDVYALHEQLPYAYFFREALSGASLEASLAQVLTAFPVLGGRLCLNSHAIKLSEEDVVPLAIGHTRVPLEEWMGAGHGVDPKTGRPQLLQLFDPLPEQPWNSRTPLARVRVTHMADGGTCIGVNISHAAADAASCIQFVYCWGRQHRGLPYPIPSNNRAEVNVNGMLTAESADLMNLHDAGSHTKGSSIISQVLGFSTSALGLAQAVPKPRLESTVVAHGYLLLPFSIEVLRAMKTYGASECARVLAAGGDNLDGEKSVRFVSTNDMVTSAGWMLMRQLSGNQDWAMNIVVNIRGRGGTEDFGAGHGLFGNGITAATASATTEPTSTIVELQSVARGARAVRRALMRCYKSLPARLVASQRGVPKLPAAVGPAFCTTTWHFPLQELAFDVSQAFEAHAPSKFGQGDYEHGQPIAFHGQPVHPLPPGETYAGVVVPSVGMDYQLFLPVAKMAEARRSHEQLCKAFLSNND